MWQLFETNTKNSALEKLPTIIFSKKYCGRGSDGYTNVLLCTILEAALLAFMGSTFNRGRKIA